MNRQIELQIPIQGSPKVNIAVVVYQSPSVVLIEIDMHSKYTQVTASMGNSIFISASEYSLHLDPKVNPNIDTEIKFPEFENFQVFSVSSSRYTISLTLRRNN